jgi:hypothetical protein
MNLLALLLACNDYDLEKKDDPTAGVGTYTDEDGQAVELDDACDPVDLPPEACGTSDACDWGVGGFTPVVEWDVPGTTSTALPVVGDIDGDGMPEIVMNEAFLGPGVLVAYRGDGSGEVWRCRDCRAGYGAAPALADVDRDGTAEVYVVREHASETFTFGSGDYTVVRVDGRGRVVAESPHYTDDEFDYATGIVISDMDHDGTPEIVAGRAIFTPDLAERGVGRFGRGAPMTAPVGIFGEGAQPAVVDLDLDGEEEVVVGNAAYDADGNTVWRTRSGEDGAVAIANLDGDPQGEFVRVWGNTITAHDTDGTTLWGPLQNPGANIFPIPAVGDVDGDGRVEIVVAGGNELWTLRDDGSTLWTAAVLDQSGATGASLFDFDADGVMEVVYIDEVQMVAFNGNDGSVKFQSNEHASATMYDHPVIADVDADGHAEIVVVHDRSSAGMSIYGDADDSWAPARGVWNQHAYSITNIEDDLSVPETAVPNFTTYNSWHSALPLPPGGHLGDELEVEIVSVCTEDCDADVLRVLGRGLNTGNATLAAGIRFALYGVRGADEVLLGTAQTASATPAQRTTAAIAFDVPRDRMNGVTALRLAVDDDGDGVGSIAECVESNNTYVLRGEFCGWVR